MHETPDNLFRKLKQRKRRQQKITTAFCSLALFVAVGVFWQLRLVGITMTDEASCGKVEHVHTEECIAEKRLICGFADESAEELSGETELQLICQLEEHTHDDNCYTVERKLVCGHDHVHNDSCYTIEKVLACEKGHVHDDSCYTDKQVLICSEDHEHEKECYEIQRVLTCELGHEHGEDCYEFRKVLTCGENHEHDESCYVEEKVLSCAKPEHTHGENCMGTVEGDSSETTHVHTDACYEITYSCGFEEEHTHTLSCYSDPNADVESQQDWESTLPEQLKGNWAKDLVAVARSQLGYKESEDNFILAEDEETMLGYTRYGEWFGNPYGNWSAMFVSFCLHYSGIPETAVPQASGAYPMAQKLEENELLEDPEEYQPKDGDLVFFDFNHDSRPEKVGILSEVGENNRIISVIEGDYENEVVEHPYLIPLPGDVALPQTEGDAEFRETRDGTIVLLAGDIYGYCDIGTLQAFSQVNRFLELGEDASIMARPMMQALTRDETGKRIPWDDHYEQLYIDVESPIRAAEYNDKQIIEVQIADEYDNFKFDHAEIHKHAATDLAPDAPEGIRNPGVTCQGEGRIELEFIEYRQITDETTGKILNYVVLGFDQDLIDADNDVEVTNWCVAAYYKLEDQKTSRNPATFFDYDYSGGVNGGNGINSSENYQPGTTQRLGVGLKDNYHTGGHDNMGNHPWNAPVGGLDANANNGQNGNNLVGNPIIQGLVTEATGDNYANVQWTVDEPGLFSQSPCIGKNIYSNYDLEFFNLGNTYVLDAVFNKTTGRYSTQGVFNIANNGTHQEGANFWPLDDLRGSINDNQFFNHIYAADIRDKYHNWYFGMRYDFKFSLNPEYVGDLYFTFAGDDDMWVLLDGVPILDLGGMHSAYPTRYQVSGPGIEFPQGGNTGEYPSNENWKNRVDLWDYLDENDFGEHTITVLYMERGGYDSNCYMEFTLPNVTPVPRVIIPNAELEIRKVGADGKPLNGAEFMLCKDKEGKIPAPFYENKNLTGYQDDGILHPAGADGCHVYGISDGTYYLFETHAPSGYEKLDGPVLIFTVVDGMIVNQQSFHGSVKVEVSGVQVGLTAGNAEAGKTTINVKAVKNWNDDGKDHSSDSVTVQLYRNGEAMDGDAYTVTLNADNDWTHIWSGLLTSSAQTGEIFQYTVVENSVEGYGAEYDVQRVPGLKAWVRTDTITAGETYILTNGKDKAMYTNANGATVFGANTYPANNSSGNFQISINGDILTTDDIPNNIRWFAQSNGNYFQFLNEWSRDTVGVTEKYLRIEGNGNTFKTANSAYRSYFSYVNGQFMGFNEGNTNGTQYRVRFENGKFSSGESGTGDNIVPFVWKSMPDTYEITITNTPESCGVELPETGGLGIFLYTLGGLLLMAAPLLYGCVPKRRRKGSRN